MTLEEFKKKYGTDTASIMIGELMQRLQLSPHALKIYMELREDLRALLK